ncbi:hypothetical protein Taro_027543, partial [Colocasia esculenta]|nr:hypothetical protein [Colocasia esculenta]
LPPKERLTSDYLASLSRRKPRLLGANPRRSPLSMKGLVLCRSLLRRRDGRDVGRGADPRRLLSLGVRGFCERPRDSAPTRRPGCLADSEALGARNGVKDAISIDPVGEVMSVLLGPLALYRTLVKEGKLQYDYYQERVATELEGLLGRLEQYEKEMEQYHAKLAMWENSREDGRRKLLVEEAQVKQKGGVYHTSFVDKWISRRRNENVEPGVGKMVSYLNREKKLDSLVGCRPVAPPAPKGLYLYGNVGSGKTMLMDMFYSATEGVVKHRRRFHFHEAMLQIHEHMHSIWKKQVEDKPLQSSVFQWINNLPFDIQVKEWLLGEERYKQEAQMKHILPAVADKFLLDRQSDHSGASILCFDEIQV